MRAVLSELDRERRLADVSCIISEILTLNLLALRDVAYWVSLPDYR